MSMLTQFTSLMKGLNVAFFRTNTKEEQKKHALTALQYLPKNPAIKQADFLYIGHAEQYDSPHAYFFVWQIHPNQPLEQQPVIMIRKYKLSPIGVVACDFSAFLGRVLYPQSMITGLHKSYTYIDKTANNKPTETPIGNVDWEIAQYQSPQLDQNPQKAEIQQYLDFLAENKIPLCEKVVEKVFEDMQKFPLLDSEDFIHKLSKNFPDMAMPQIVKDFYTFLEKNHIYLPDFEDDRGTQALDSGLVPHFVSLEYTHHFIKLGQTGSGGYVAIWHIFPDKKLEDNPVLFLDSEASPLAVVACNFQEYICIAHAPIYNMIGNVEYAVEHGNEIEDYDEQELQNFIQEHFVAQHQADE